MEAGFSRPELFLGADTSFRSALPAFVLVEIRADPVFSGRDRIVGASLRVYPGAVRISLVRTVGRTVTFHGSNVLVVVVGRRFGLICSHIIFRHMERTFAIIKPDAVKSRYTGRIIQRIEEAGFTIRAIQMRHLSLKEAEGFYAVHRERPFFGSLTQFMSSGPCVVLALEAEDAIKKWRTLMGATDPAKADAGTLRKEFGASIENNATHGSDAPETAAYELGYFFPGIEFSR